MPTAVSGLERVRSGCFVGLAVGCGMALWLSIGQDWAWWTTLLLSWFVALAVMILVLEIMAPDDGRATRPDDPELVIALDNHVPAPLASLLRN